VCIGVRIFGSVCLCVFACVCLRECVCLLCVLRVYMCLYLWMLLLTHSDIVCICVCKNYVRETTDKNEFLEMKKTDFVRRSNAVPHASDLCYS